MLNSGASRCCHYLDDFYTCGSAGTFECETNMKVMLDSCFNAGLEVNPKKVVGPDTCLEFLGIIIDSVKQELRMSDKRMLDVRTELQSWLGKKSGTKRDLLSLIGKLVFLSRIIRPGRVFTRRLIDAAKRVPCLHFKTRLSHEAQEDIKWWLASMTSWNQKSVLYDDHWSSAVDMHFYCDASDTGFGAVLGDKFLSGLFTLREKMSSIECREQFAIVTACHTWSYYLRS